MKDHNIIYVPAGSIGSKEVVIRGSQLLHIRRVVRNMSRQKIDRLMKIAQSAMT